METNIVDPSELSLNIMGMKVKGFTNGTFINISRSTPKYSIRRSLKGRTQIRSDVEGFYEFKFTLDSSSADNTWLHAIYELQDKYVGKFPVPFLFKDKMGNTTFFCKSVVLQEPSLGLGNSLGSNEWVLICDKVNFIIGGNAVNDKTSEIIESIRKFLALSDIIGLDLADLGWSVLGNVSENVRGLLER